MPDRPSTVATYAISASIAALVLGYVFGPSIFPDDDSQIQDGSRRQFAVGLSNPANDCFINSVLQAFAGLKTLRDYLEQIRANGKFRQASDTNASSNALSDGVVSLALKSKLDELNATSASKKTISAVDFIRALEFAFSASISRRQQDAQEFLQVVAQRLDEEFQAACKIGDTTEDAEISDAPTQIVTTSDTEDGATARHESSNKGAIAFPLEGIIESQIECLSCGYKPKPNKSSFVTLTLNVPQKSSTSVDECLDGFFKVEVIDEFKCDRCQVEYTLKSKERQLQQHVDHADGIPELRNQIENLREAYNDPESHEIDTSNNGRTPKQRISKHAHISEYPQALALHLSRSIFNASSFSTKNAAKVEFPEILTLGFLERKSYRLACVVTHRGGHNSGHYETFRRQYSNNPDDSQTPRPSSSSGPNTGSDSVDTKAEKSRVKSQARKQSRWWCISDARIRECSTAEVLKMQKDVYLLFYELQQVSSSEDEKL